MSAPHSILSSSSAYRWMQCPASIVEIDRYKKTISNENETRHATDGTLIHEISAALLTSAKLPESSDELRAIAERYVDNIKRLTDGATCTAVEVLLDTSSVLGVPDQCGTADFVAYVDGELQVHDLKSGSVEVDSFDNLQLVLYALAARNWLKTKHGLVPKQYRVFIHQPRLDTINSTMYRPVELAAYRETLKAGAKEAMSMLDPKRKKLKYRPLPSVCKYCYAKATCVAFRCTALQPILGMPVSDLYDDKSKTMMVLRPEDLTKEMLSAVIERAPALKSWITAVEQYVKLLLMSGQKVPNCKLVNGRKGARKWAKDSEKTIKAILRHLPDVSLYSKKMVSPTKLEALLKKKHVGEWESVQQYIEEQDAGKPIVVLADDKREELKISNNNISFELLEKEEEEQ